MRPTQHQNLIDIVEANACYRGMHEQSYCGSLLNVSFIQDRRYSDPKACSLKQL